METKCYLWIHKPSGTKYLFVQTGKERVQIDIEVWNWQHLKEDGVPVIDHPNEMKGLNKRYYKYTEAFGRYEQTKKER